MKLKKKIGQITIKRIGEKYAACISGTPVAIHLTRDSAEKHIRKLRKKYGRRDYSIKNKG